MKLEEDKVRYGCSLFWHPICGIGNKIVDRVVAFILSIYGKNFPQSRQLQSPSPLQPKPTTIIGCRRWPIRPLPLPCRWPVPPPRRRALQPLHRRESMIGCLHSNV